MQYLVKIKESDGKFMVTYPDFSGLTAHGSSLEDAMKNAAKTLNSYLEKDYDGDDLPKPGTKGGRDFYEISVSNHIEIAYTLKKLRKNRTQQEIAQGLGVTRQAYQKFENPRKCNPAIKTLERLSMALGKRLEIRFK